MTRTTDKVPPEVAAVLAGKNPFVNFSRPSEVFRDVFDFGDQASHRKGDEDVAKNEKVRYENVAKIDLAYKIFSEVDD